MKRWCSFVLVLLLSCPALVRGQDLKLEIKGGGAKVVQVPKVVTVYEDRTVITALPFVVEAAPGASKYFWQFPPTVTAIYKGNLLEVTAAPAGELTVAVEAWTIDWDAKTTASKFGKVTVTIGELPPGPGPGPGPPEPVPPPLTAYDQLVQGAWVKDGSDPNAAKLGTALYTDMARYAQEPAIQTSGMLLAKLGEQARKYIPGKIRTVQGLAVARLQKLMPTDVPLTADLRAGAQAIFQETATALTKVK